MTVVGVTGADGFIGTHLKNYLSTLADFRVLPICRADFADPQLLDHAVSQCDVVVHLAGVNRHADLQVLHATNVDLVRQLLAACERTDTYPHLLFSSSTQEDRDHPYGQSKREGRQLLEDFGKQHRCPVNTLIVPNVFGPFGRPFYNSVVATFCHQLTRGEEPVIHQDSLLHLIYVNELTEQMVAIIRSRISGTVPVEPRHAITVSVLLDKLKGFQKDYLVKGVIPGLQDPLDRALFNTFRCYVPDDHYPVHFPVHADDRGRFVEIVRANTPGQSSYSTTRPGITRGNHFHTRKAERFAVIQGQATIRLRRIDRAEVIEYHLDGSSPAYVDMPVWHTHNLTNTGDGELVTLFWINEPYDPSDPDTYFVAV